MNKFWWIVAAAVMAGCSQEPQQARTKTSYGPPSFGGGFSGSGGFKGTTGISGTSGFRAANGFSGTPTSSGSSSGASLPAGWGSFSGQ